MIVHFVNESTCIINSKLLTFTMVDALNTKLRWGHIELTRQKYIRYSGVHNPIPLDDIVEIIGSLYFIEPFNKFQYCGTYYIDRSDLFAIIKVKATTL